MTDHLTQLVNRSHNFRFLAEPALLLAIDAAAAESYVDSDPDAAMGKARRFSETLARMLMRRWGIAPGGANTQNDRIKALARAEVIPERIETLFNDVRKAGNNAVHEHSGDREKAMSIVETCFELGVWWYRFETGQDVVHAFTPPVPAETASLRALLEGVEDQIAQLRAGFEASTEDAARRPEPRIRIGPAAPDARNWQGGSEVTCGSARYLVHDPVERVSPDDRSWTLMRANAHAMDSRAAPVRLCGLVTESADAAAKEMADGLMAQASFLAGRSRLRARDRRNRLPELVSRPHEGGLLTLVTSRPAGSTWAEMFGAGHGHLDPLIVPLALAALATIAEALAELHRNGPAHRALDSESILLTAAGRRGVLRDIGLAWLPRLPGEGGRYRAPEQRSIAHGRPGPPTDVFQLAALLQHTCTGFVPGAGRAIPLRSFQPGFPERLDETLVRALDPDTARRPDMGVFAADLRLGRTQLLREATA